MMVFKHRLLTMCRCDLCPSRQGHNSQLPARSRSNKAPALGDAAATGVLVHAIFNTSVVVGSAVLLVFLMFHDPVDTGLGSRVPVAVALGTQCAKLAIAAGLCLHAQAEVLLVSRAHVAVGTHCVRFRIDATEHVLDVLEQGVEDGSQPSFHCPEIVRHSNSQSVCDVSDLRSVIRGRACLSSVVQGFQTISGECGRFFRERRGGSESIISKLRETDRSCDQG